MNEPFTYTDRRLASPFAVALAANIRAKVKELKAAGTVSMGSENLRQIVRPPSPWLAGAPCGANAAYAYARIFGEVLAAMKMPKGFKVGFSTGRPV